MNSGLKIAAYSALTALLIGLRTYHLSADPPQWLSWSSGIYSDEGIYAADARSVVLFGHWTGGDFHSALIVPLHHLALLGLFRLFGVSLVAVRYLGVASSLIGLLFFFLTLRRQFDERTALLGVIFLGLSPVFVFYNRLGLLETPAVCLLIVANYLSTFERVNLLSGIFLAAAVVYKPLAVLCVPAMFADFKEKPSLAVQKLIGLVGGLALYALIWQMPYRDTLSRINRYYVIHQYLPHSLNAFGRNIVRSLWSGSSDGILPYLIHHAPILAALAVVSIWNNRQMSTEHKRYWLWFTLPALALCCISYEPSRYFILFWPGLCGCAAIAVGKMEIVWERSVAPLFILSSCCTFIVAIKTETFEMRNAGRLLGEKLQAGQLIAGQYAPELSLCNRLNSLYVQPGLANTKANLTGALILVTRSQYWDSYWTSRRAEPSSVILGSSVTPVQLQLPHDQIVDGWVTVR